MAEYLHDGVQLCAALGELGANSVAEAMGRDGGPAYPRQPCVREVSGIRARNLLFEAEDVSVQPQALLS